jgi:hypothetical protein
MAVAFDATTESHTGTTGSTSEASFSFSHGGAGSVQGAGVFVLIEGTTTDLVGTVTYGGTTVPAEAGGRAVDTAGEVGSCKLHYLGASVPGGTQTVVVNRTNTADVMYAICWTVTAGADTEVTGILLEQENQALTEENIDDGSPGVNSLRFCGLHTGRGVVPGVGANSTLMHGIDYGARAHAACRETTAGQGSRPVGFAVGSADDVAAVYCAVREIVVAGYLDYLAAVKSRRSSIPIPVMM